MLCPNCTYAFMVYYMYLICMYLGVSVPCHRGMPNYSLEIIIIHSREGESGFVLFLFPRILGNACLLTSRGTVVSEPWISLMPDDARHCLTSHPYLLLFVSLPRKPIKIPGLCSFAYGAVRVLYTF